MLSFDSGVGGPGIPVLKSSLERQKYRLWMHHMLNICSYFLRNFMEDHARTHKTNEGDGVKGVPGSDNDIQ